jgi:hypothetical protein
LENEELLIRKAFTFKEILAFIGVMAADEEFRV